MTSEVLEYTNVVFKSPREIVYLDYPPSQLPEKPTPPPTSSNSPSLTGGDPHSEWTRFICISDTHSRTFSVPPGDVLLHSGDLTNLGTVDEFRKTMEWLYALPHKIKIIIAGNHDLTLHADWYEGQWEDWHKRQGKQDLQAILMMLKGDYAKNAGIVYLQDERYEFRVREGGRMWSVYGSPWSPEFCDWAFNYAPEDAEEIVSKFPNTDILLTHCPARGIFDRTTIGGEHVGCEALRTRLGLSELRPRLHVAGHIHEAHGAYIHTWDSPDSNCSFSPSSDSSRAEPPSVQNDDERVLSSQSFMDAGVEEEGKGEGEKVEGRRTLAERTVFVNAANWPMGWKTKRPGKWAPVRIPFGGPGFQAVVVDLKD